MDLGTYTSAFQKERSVSFLYLYINKLKNRYITSLDFDVEQFGKSVRGHWGVENGLHWALDVVFREDAHWYQARIGAANLSLMRKIALGILKRDTTIKKGKAIKLLKAITLPSYRDHL
jgi:predicted transposase YbfD/YdcC